MGLNPHLLENKIKQFDYISDISKFLQNTMTDLDLLQNAEFKEAFDEFDKVCREIDSSCLKECFNQ